MARWPDYLDTTINRDFKAWYKKNYPEGRDYAALRKQLRKAFAAGYRTGYKQCRVDYKGN